MRELKIQLHPLELGVVTAHLRTVGEKLSVELKVDNHDAYHRLSADSDAIIKSLRSLGFDIDSVSIQQPQAAATAVARSEASAGTGSFSRDTPSFQPGNSGSGSERFGGQTSGRGERGGAQGNDAAQPLNRIALAAASISSGSVLAASAATNPCEPEILRAADRYSIPVGILYAVGLTETGNKGSLQPNALNIEGKAVFPASQERGHRRLRQGPPRGARR